MSRDQGFSGLNLFVWWQPGQNFADLDDEQADRLMESTADEVVQSRIVPGSWRMRYGVDLRTGDVASLSLSRMQVSLWNHDGRYSEENPDSPLSNVSTAGARLGLGRLWTCRMQSTQAGDSTTFGSGWITSIQTQYDRRTQLHIAKLEGSGFFWRLAEERGLFDSEGGRSTGQHIRYILTQAGIVPEIDLGDIERTDTFARILGEYPQSYASLVSMIAQLATAEVGVIVEQAQSCLLYTSPSPRDRQKSRMPSSA